MGEDCPGDAFQLAPLELRADRGVAYDVFPAPSLQWPSDACPVAYVERHAAQHRLLIQDCRHVRGVREHRPSYREAMAHPGGTEECSAQMPAK